MADQPSLDRFKALVDGLLKFDTPCRLLLNISRLTKTSVRSKKDGEFRDFKLVCEGVEFWVHKVVICALSPVLRAACKGRFEVSKRWDIFLPL